MATKKHGQLTTSGEWARHLRPLLKRWFWKAERREEVSELQRETSGDLMDSVEELLDEVHSWPEGKLEAELRVAAQLKYDGAPVTSDVAMAIVLDAILGKGLLPAGKSEVANGSVYFYVSS